MFNINFCRWLDSNRGPLVLEATALPTEPHNHCPGYSVIIALIFQYSGRSMPRTGSGDSIAATWLPSAPTYRAVRHGGPFITSSKRHYGFWCQKTHRFLTWLSSACRQCLLDARQAYWPTLWIWFGLGFRWIVVPFPKSLDSFGDKKVSIYLRKVWLRECHRRCCTGEHC